jgi:hypothetical protein
LIFLAGGQREHMPTEPPVVTVAQAVHRAVEACELGPPDEDGLARLLLRFEDDDEPIRPLIEVLPLRLDEALGEIDVDWEESGSLSMARAVVVYLAFRRDEIDSEAAVLLRLAARAEYDGEPPAAVERWLLEAGVEL